MVLEPKLTRAALGVSAAPRPQLASALKPAAGRLPLGGGVATAGPALVRSYCLRNNTKEQTHQDTDVKIPLPTSSEHAVVIGRSRKCDARLVSCISDVSQNISRKHAIVSVSLSGEILLTDSASEAALLCTVQRYPTTPLRQHHTRGGARRFAFRIQSSVGGVFVNWKRIPPELPTSLKIGDVVVFG